MGLNVNCRQQMQQQPKRARCRRPRQSFVACILTTASIVWTHNSSLLCSTATSPTPTFVQSFTFPFILRPQPSATSFVQQQFQAAELWSTRSGRGTKRDIPHFDKSNSKSVNKSVKVTKQQSSSSPISIESPLVGQKGDARISKPKTTLKQRVTPPWQVLSAEDATKNVQKEIQRRNLVQQGMKEKDALEAVNQSIIGQINRPSLLSKSFLSDSERRLISWKRFQPDRVLAGIRFIGSYRDSHILPPRIGVPEIAFLGRSNVGKSSLLNRLAATTSSRASPSSPLDQARVGKTPGATASVNLYTLLDTQQREVLAFVDLPGFGYAKLAKEIQESIQSTAEKYLNHRSELMLAILLVDIRRKPVDQDRAVLAALFDMGVPIMVVATKIDKVSETERQENLLAIQEGLGLPSGQPYCVSSVTGEGCRGLWQIILEACETAVLERKSKYDEQPTIGNNDGDDDAYENDMVDDDDDTYSQGFDWVHNSNLDQ